MKRIVYLWIIIASFTTIIPGTYAAWGEGSTETVGTNNTNSSGQWARSSITSKETTVVYTTEKVPGAKCECWTNGADGKFDKSKCSTNITERKYECTVGIGMSGFQSMLKNILTYFVRIVALLGVLAIVALGIAWAWAWGDDIKAKSKLKWWAVNIIVGMAILFFFEYILKFLAPSIFQ